MRSPEATPKVHVVFILGPRPHARAVGCEAPGRPKLEQAARGRILRHSCRVGDDHIAVGRGRIIGGGLLALLLLLEILRRASEATGD
jgi:hypothetical protein